MIGIVLVGSYGIGSTKKLVSFAALCCRMALQCGLLVKVPKLLSCIGGYWQIARTYEALEEVR